MNLDHVLYSRLGDEGLEKSNRYETNKYINLWHSINVFISISRHNQIIATGSKSGQMTAIQFNLSPYSPLIRSSHTKAHQSHPPSWLTICTLSVHLSCIHQFHPQHNRNYVSKLPPPGHSSQVHPTSLRLIQRPIHLTQPTQIPRTQK
jgi:hypothetical protein